MVYPARFVAALRKTATVDIITDDKGKEEERYPEYHEYEEQADAFHIGQKADLPAAGIPVFFMEKYWNG